MKNILFRFFSKLVNCLLTMELMVWDLTAPLHLSAMNGCFPEFEEKKIINFSGHTENVNLFITRGAYVNSEENTEIPPL